MKRPRRDGAAGPAAVLHHDLLAEHAGHLLGNDARHCVVAAAGRKRHHQRDRTRGIILRCNRQRAGEYRCERRSGDSKATVHQSLLRLSHTNGQNREARRGLSPFRVIRVGVSISRRSVSGAAT